MYNVCCLYLNKKIFEIECFIYLEQKQNLIFLSKFMKVFSGIWKERHQEDKTYKEDV